MQTALWVGNMIPLSFPATKTTYVWFRRSMSHLFFSSRAMRFGGAIPLRAGAMISEMSGYVCLFSSISEREREIIAMFLVPCLVVFAAKWWAKTGVFWLLQVQHIIAEMMDKFISRSAQVK
jgi:hypothetical protein